MSDDIENTALRMRVTELELVAERVGEAFKAQMSLNETFHRNIRIQFLLSTVQTVSFAVLAIAVALLPGALA